MLILVDMSSLIVNRTLAWDSLQFDSSGCSDVPSCDTKSQTDIESECN